MVGTATLTTVLSSIAIAKAKHIVSSTMPFSRAFSPSKPNMIPLCYVPDSNPGRAAVVPDLGAVRPAYRLSGRTPGPHLSLPHMLELIDLRRRFGDVVALDGVSFEVPPGRIVGFVGRNGAGKTTAMRISLGVLEADAGQVRWRGEAIDTGVRRRFGYMPEERGLYPKMKVLEQIVYLARLHGYSKSAATDAATALLERLGLGERLGDNVETLSLGNQQRAQIAAALVHDPDVLILDEPFSGLDPMAVDSVAGVLQERAAAGTAVLFSSHQLDLVERLCDDLV